jgi:8-oxo-dGTP pyrophosphatase MutT (NUDIX family)
VGVKAGPQFLRVVPPAVAIDSGRPVDQNPHMDGLAELRECVACLLIADGHVLAERRRLTKTVAPGAVAIPGGHVEAGEAAEAALRREMQEELGVVPRDLRHVCTLLHRSAELRRIHYFALAEWKGTITNHEAAALLWLPLTAPERLDLDVDRTAVAEYRRVYASAGEGPSPWSG